MPLGLQSLGRFLGAAAVAASESTPAHARTAGPDTWQNRLEPIGAADWNYDFAAHLLERAGFGGTPEEIQALAKLTPAQAVARMVRFEGAESVNLPAFDESGIHDAGLEPFPPSRPAVTDMAKQKGEALGIKVKPAGNRRLQPVVDEFFYWLRASALETNRVAYWWADRMLNNPRPLQEKMALFWHGHFASNEAKVRDYRKLLGQLELFQKQGIGNFRDLTVAVAQRSRDAMLSGRRRQRQGRFQREFRPRNHGAVHHGRGPLHRKRHPRGRPCIHRLELRGHEVRGQ